LAVPRENVKLKRSSLVGLIATPTPSPAADMLQPQMDPPHLSLMPVGEDIDELTISPALDPAELVPTQVPDEIFISFEGVHAGEQV